MPTGLIEALCAAAGVLMTVLLRAYIFGRGIGGDESMIKQHEAMINAMDNTVSTIDKSLAVLGESFRRFEKLDYIGRSEYLIQIQSLISQVQSLRAEFERHLNFHEHHITNERITK